LAQIKSKKKPKPSSSSFPDGKEVEEDLEISDVDSENDEPTWNGWKLSDPMMRSVHEKMGK
jgi:hypothetical protein